MITHVFFLASGFVVILCGSELFTNGIEWMGEAFGVSEAAVGSLLAAVGTALPETLIPIVALLLSRGAGHAAVGVGAIVGAPLMLSTVAMLVMGVACVGYRSRRGRTHLLVVPQNARRDLLFFGPVFLLAMVAGLLDLGLFTRRIIAVGLLLVYAFYSYLMLRVERLDEEAVEHGLYLERLLKGNPHAPRILATLAQTVVGTLAILLGAYQFVEAVVSISSHANLNPEILSLVLSPLATELPEKYNSVVWIRSRKDHLALANITGAMVFQSCIPVAVGLSFSDWHMDSRTILAGGIALFSAALLYWKLDQREIHLPILFTGGAAYAAFIIGLLYVSAG